MSAVANSAAPAPAPERVPPPARAHVRSRRWLWFSLIAAVAALAAGGFWLSRQQQVRRAALAPAIKTYRVAPVAFQRTVRIAGSTSARGFANIAAPMMRGPDSGRSMVLISLAKSGVLVKKGDLIAQIDAQATKDHADDVAALVTQAEGDIRKRKADQAIETETLMQSVREAKAALDKAKLDYGAQEIRTSIDQELLKLSVEEAQANYDELLKEVEIDKGAHAAEIRILELTRDRHKRHRDRHLGDVQRFTMNAPITGLTVMQSIWRGGDMGQVQLGDQITPGQPFMKIVDTNTMQLDASVNQVESEGIRLGQSAEVRFDAFPDLRAKGRVHSIGALAVGGWRQNYFIRMVPVNIEILSHDPRMIPDLSASALILQDTKEGALAVPLEAIFEQGGKTLAYVKQGDGFQPREVKTGERNNTQVIVLAGLTAGDEIALSRPSAAAR